MLARRQQRASQRERQRKDRVAEADKRQIRRETLKHVLHLLHPSHLVFVDVHAVLEDFHVALGMGGRREAVAAV
jgi:hypothetical protein